MNPSPQPAPRSGLLSNDLARLLLLCAVVGVASGLGAIAFYWGLEAVHYFTVEQIAGYHPSVPGGEQRLFPESHTPFRPWLLFLLPAAGGLLSGLIVYRWAPEAAGEGADAAIEAYHHPGAPMRKRVPFIKILASSIMIGTGGSGGREGPIAQIGSGLASILAAHLKLSPTERRTLMAAGMAAGIGSIFHAPLAGAIFAAEILYKDMDFEHEVLVPAFISSIVSYTVFCSIFGWSPVFVTPNFTFHDPLQLVPYAVLAVVVALAAILFIRVFHAVKHGFENLKIPLYLKPALGGLVVGCFAFFLPESLGTGYGVLQDALGGESGGMPDAAGLGAGLLLAIAAGKIVTTSFSVGSGGSGGAFGPAVVIGGTLGGAVGQLAAYWLPTLNIDPGAFVVVGMAGFFAGAANCPISTIIMVSEMSGNYHLLVPSMLVCIVSYLVARKHTIYEKQLQSRLDAPTKMGNMLSAVLRRITVRESLAQGSGSEWDGLGLDTGAADAELITIPENLTLSEMIHRLADTDQSVFPIVGAGGLLTGMVDWEDIRRVLGDRDTVAELVVARDLARPAVTITLDDSLLDAVRTMTRANATELIVVDTALGGGSSRSAPSSDRTPSAPLRPLATLSHNCVMRTYDEALLSGQPQQTL